MIKRSKIRQLSIVCLLLFIICTANSFVIAAESADQYLKYQEPQPSSPSWLSTVAYVFSLLITFAAVIILAYATSKFLGQKYGRISGVGSNKVIASLSLGPNRSVAVVEVAGKFIVLGVTDHSINFLLEITDTEQIDKLKAQQDNVSNGPIDTVFERQLIAFQQLANKFPGVFTTGINNSREQEREKR